MWFRVLGSGIKVLCFCSAEFGDCHGGLGVGIGVWWVLVVRFHGLGTRVWALGFVLVKSVISRISGLRFRFLDL